MHNLNKHKFLNSNLLHLSFGVNCKWSSALVSYSSLAMPFHSPTGLCQDKNKLLIPRVSNKTGLNLIRKIITSKNLNTLIENKQTELKKPGLQVNSMLVFNNQTNGNVLKLTNQKNTSSKSFSSTKIFFNKIYQKKQVVLYSKGTDFLTNGTSFHFNDMLQSLNINKSSNRFVFQSSYSKQMEINLITISLASANRIRQWAEKTLPNGKVVGEVINPETVHYKTLKPIKGGLFCERIFGPLKDHECACGKKFNIKNYLAKEPKNLAIENELVNKLQKRYFCRVCDVEYTYSIIRRTQLGFIQLASPTTHVWFVKGIPSYISILLDMKKKHLQNVTYNSETLTLEHAFRGRQYLPSSPSSIFESWQKIMKIQYPEKYGQKTVLDPGSKNRKLLGYSQTKKNITSITNLWQKEQNLLYKQNKKKYYSHKKEFTLKRAPLFLMSSKMPLANKMPHVMPYYSPSESKAPLRRSEQSAYPYSSISSKKGWFKLASKFLTNASADANIKLTNIYISTQNDLHLLITFLGINTIFNFCFNNSFLSSNNSAFFYLKLLKINTKKLPIPLYLLFFCKDQLFKNFLHTYTPFLYIEKSQSPKSIYVEKTKLAPLYFSQQLLSNSLRKVWKLFIKINQKTIRSSFDATKSFRNSLLRFTYKTLSSKEPNPNNVNASFDETKTLKAEKYTTKLAVMLLLNLTNHLTSRSPKEMPYLKIITKIKAFTIFKKKLKTKLVQRLNACYLFNQGLHRNNLSYQFMEKMQSQKWTRALGPMSAKQTLHAIKYLRVLTLYFFFLKQTKKTLAYKLYNSLMADFETTENKYLKYLFVLKTLFTNGRMKNIKNSNSYGKHFYVMQSLSTIALGQLKKKMQSNQKNLLVNNIYCLSHRELWEQEKDWQDFAYYYYSPTNITDIPIPFYKHRNYDLLFSIDNTLTYKTQIDMNINTAFSGAGLIQKLLNEFNYSELKKMDKQNRILLFEYNKHIKKLKKMMNSRLIKSRLEYYKACHIRDVLIRRTKLTRKIFNINKDQPSMAMEATSGNETNGLNMILTLLPVLPPVLRPVLKMAGQFTISDLNRLYQRIIYRNERLKKFLKDPALSSSFEMKYAQRLLQEAVDNLIQNGKSGVVPEKDARGRLLKSLSDILKGKQGRFRQYLLGKRVDYSGRSVIVVGPSLKLHECGIPKEMALVLYSPFLIKRILNEKLADTYLSAKKLILTNPLLVSQLLREIMKSCPVLLNRAPTLHRLGFQAFQPKLVDGKAILLHPLVCPAFNADFDGDQMAVHVPITFEARAEAWKLMLARNNLLSPATGEPLILPSQDMVLGCYYLTTNCAEKWSKFKKGSGMYFHNINDVLKAYNQQLIHVHAIIWVNITGHVENANTLEEPLELRISLAKFKINKKHDVSLANINSNKQIKELRTKQNLVNSTKDISYVKNHLNYIEIYSKSHNILHFNGTVTNQIIRTTPGKILFNMIIKNAMEKRPALLSKYNYETGLIKNKLIHTFELQTTNFFTRKTSIKNA